MEIKINEHRKEKSKQSHNELRNERGQKGKKRKKTETEAKGDKEGPKIK